jgi:hypothetical protein
MRRLARHRSGAALIEFSLGAPFILVAGLWGTEEANYALVNMKIGQLAVHLADNGSRIGDVSTLENRRIYESDINDLLFGAQLQAGTGIDLYQHGRVILSSLTNTDDYQHIQWQRCRGAKRVSSSYGTEGDSMPSGMGPASAKVTAEPDEAVIFVELVYTYQPLISDKFVGRPEIRSIASFAVRDDRDLTQIYQRDPNDPDPIQRCSAFSGPVQINSDGSFGTVSSSTSSSTTTSTSTTSGGGSTTSTGGSTGGATTSSTGGTSTSTSTTTGGSTTTTGGSTTTTTTTTGGGGGGSGGRGGGRGGGSGGRP